MMDEQTGVPGAQTDDQSTAPVASPVPAPESAEPEESKGDAQTTV